MYSKIKKYLLDNNIKIDDVINSLSLVDLSDGKGPSIGDWDEVKIGIKKPTKEVLSSISIDDILLKEAQDSKKAELKSVLKKMLSKNILFKDDLYMKVEPEVNLFLAYKDMTSTEVKNWGCYSKEGVFVDGIDMKKSELQALSKGYETYKSNMYKIYNKAKKDIFNSTDIKYVESFDTTKIYN